VSPPLLCWFKGRPLNCVSCGYGCWSNDGVLPMCGECYGDIRRDRRRWPSWWTQPISAGPVGSDAYFFTSHGLHTPLADPLEHGAPAPAAERDDERTSPAIAYAIGLLLWFPPSPLPGPLTVGSGRPPRWWTPDGAADRVRARLGLAPRDLSELTWSELDAALRASIDKARADKEKKTA
jgi:hypothetical protein